MKRIFFFITFFFLLAPVITNADININIEPPMPTTLDDVRVIVSGVNSDPCFNISSSHKIVGNNVEVSVNIVELDADSCLQVLTPWAAIEDLGQLPQGEYEVTATIESPCCFPCDPICIEKRSFNVAQHNPNDCFHEGTIEILNIDPPKESILEIGETYTFSAQVKYSYGTAVPGAIIVAVEDAKTLKLLDNNQIANDKDVFFQTGEETLSVTTTISLDNSSVSQLSFAVSLLPKEFRCTKVKDEVLYTTRLSSDCPHDGDINMDGQVDKYDVKLAFESLFNPMLLTRCEREHADVDCNNEVTMNDVKCLFDTLLGSECICQKSAIINEFDKFVSSRASVIDGNAAEEDVTTGKVETLGSGSSDIELTSDPDKNKQQVIGFRFPNIDVPQGATILSAYIQFVSDENQKRPVSITFHGEAIDNASLFQKNLWNVTNRQTTVTSINWNPENWNIGDAHAAQQTPNLSSIIQEIVNRAGWVQGNALAFIISSNDFTNHRTAENSSANGPVLTIVFETDVCTLFSDSTEVNDFSKDQEVVTTFAY